MSVSRHVEFKSTVFNTTEERSYFFNPGSFGDDVASWFIAELPCQGVTVDKEPGQEDFGWYMYFYANAKRYCLLISYQPGENSLTGYWMCTIERVSGTDLISAFLGARTRGIDLAAPWAIHKVLSTSKEVSDIRWFLGKNSWSDRNSRPTPFEE